MGSAKIYRGPDGIRVAILGLEDGTYLVRVTGTTHKLDGKVLRCKFIVESRSLHVYSTPYDGHDLYLFKRVVGGREGVRHLLNLPGHDFVQNLPVEFDEEASTALKPEDLTEAHEAQKADGSLDALLRFDLQGRIKLEESFMERDVERTNQVCGSRLRMTMDWDALPSKTRETLRVRSLCDEVLGAFRQFCEDEEVRQTVQKHLRELRCRVDDGEKLDMRLDRGTLSFTIGRRGINKHLTARKAVAEELRWPGAENIAQKIYGSRTQFCTDGKGNYVGWRPRRAPDRWDDKPYELTMYYGSAQKLIEVPRVNLGERFFYDPRYVTGTSGWGPRGNYSYVHLDRKTGSCFTVCGTRKVALQVLSRGEMWKTLGATTFGPSLPQRQPHGLARDRAGTYYYVDRAAGEGATDFRLYRGPLGRMVLQRMVNIVSDSEGEVYSTKTGALRLVLEREHSYWVERGRKSTLVNVPIAKNIGLIYNELGVYVGRPLGTPCDIF
ncbi:MAG: hypothetical protein RBU30_00230 [Polyangia bacterium]|nr:hypothetical protein [Polyangia bacterium]